MRVESDSSENSGELKALVAENLKLTRDLAFSIKKIRRYIFWLQLTNLLKFILIAIPLVLGVVYLRPLVTNLVQTYQQLLGDGSAVGSLNKVQGGASSIQNLLNSPEAQEFLKNSKNN